MSDVDVSGDENEFDPFAGPAILDTAPSTEPQREVWTATHTGSDASLGFNESIVLTFGAGLDIEALKAALSDLVARHESLRMTFTADGLTLCVAEAQPVEARFESLEELSHAEQNARCEEHAREEVETPFDLERGPLFRVCMMALSPTEWRVIFTAHHIVCDGWSMAVLLKDWAALYNARRSPRASRLAPAQSFSAYARAEVERARSRDYTADELHWITHLKGEIPALELPLDRPRPPVRGYRARRCDVALDAALIQALKKMGAAQRASLFTTLLAGFNTLLLRLSGQEDLVVGIPAAGQSVGGYDSLVGHCVNMLPLRCQLESKQTFSSLLGKVRSTMLDAYEHQAYTFGTLLTKLPLTRDPSRPPLVSVVFNVDRALTSESIGFDGVHVAVRTTPRAFENFELFINAVELPEGMILECQYNSALFDDSTVRRYMASFAQLLRAVARDPNVSLGAIPIVAPEDSARLAAWNLATRADLPEPRCVHRLVEEWAERCPAGVACRFEGEDLTYAALNGRANQLARALRRAGVKRGALVGLSVERSPSMLVGLLGILKAGAAYVPLDPGYPRERLAFMVEDAQMPALVTEQKPLRELALSAPTIIALDGDAHSLAREATHNLSDDESDARPDDVAYVIYTSGSTGKPKGVLVSHESAVNLLKSVAKVPGLQARDRVLAVTTLSFDIALSELVLPLTVGATIVLASREVASDGARLLALVRQEKVSFIDATPATYRLLLSAGFDRDPALRVICTGEAMPKDLAHELVARVGEVWNGYGPTETTVWSTFYRVRAPVTRILIGRPVDNTQIHVLDANMQPTPIGVPGELFIGGHGVSRGYLGRDDLTQLRFVPDPFSATPGARMYKTGDVGRYLENGDLECMGRNDHQIKLRGYRIELGEIEDALGQHAAVRQCAVILREDRPGDMRLVGYATLQAGAVVGDAELRAHLKRNLPDYMVPSLYVRLDSMPLTPSGKIDRKALPAPDASAVASDTEYVAPSTPSQLLLAALWQEALNLPRVSVKDDFFALGGHSLLASQVLARLRRDHGIELSFRTVFEAPTLERLAEVLERTDTLSGSTNTSSVKRRGHADPAPLSVAQERIWLLEEMDPAQELVHNLPAAWLFSGEVKLPILQAALDEIVRRHDTLRTVLAMHDGHPVQVVRPQLTIPIVYSDLTDIPEPDREPHLMRTVSALTREKFDLRTGPLFRSHLFKLGADSYFYYTNRHNLIWDGWSFDIFLRELTQLYGAFDAGQSSPLKELPVTYGDYVAFQREFLESASLKKQTAWWQNQLRGDLPELALPTDRPRLAKSEHAGGYTTYRFSSADREAFTALSRSAGGTLFMVLFAAYNVMLHRYSGQNELLVGSPVRARNRPEVEDLIGAFINAVVLRTRLEPDMTFHALLARVRDMTLDSFSHEDMPLERLGARPPVLRALFSLQDARQRPPALGSIPVTQKHVELRAASNDMMVWMMDTRSELLAVVNYSTELFDAATIERFLRGFSAVLRAAVENPEARICDLPIAVGDDMAEVQSWGHPRAKPVQNVLQQLAEHALRQPSRVAIRDGERALSYAELLRRIAGVSSALAGHVRGVAPLVAVCASAGAERVVGMLGALHAGAAFTVIDPALPAARRTALLAVLKPDVIWTSDAIDELDVVAPVIRDDATGHSEVFTAVETADDACAWVTCHFDADGEGACEVVSRGALFTAVDQAVRALAFEEAAEVLSFSPASSELALFEQLSPLAAGACVRFDAELAHLSATPAGTAVVVCAPESAFARLDTNELARLGRAVVVGPASASLVAAFALAGVSAQRVHAYPAAGYAPFVQALRSSADVRRLGRVHAPALVDVRDEHGTRTPAVVPGELWLSSSVPVAPAKQRWVLQSGEARRAGQRARFANDGTVELTSSAVGYAWRAGQRIALGEASRCLRRHASIADAYVSAGHEDGGDARLTAYVVVRPGAAYTESELRRQLRAQLPEVFVPHAFVEVDVLPRRDDGSVDDATLNAIFDDTREKAHVPPRTASERLVAELWADALGAPRIGVYDNFFDLGGYSLLCFKVITSIEEKAHVRISPRVMLLGSLEQVAVAVDNARPTTPEKPVQMAATTPVQAARPESTADAQGGTLFKRLRDLMRGGRD